MALFQDVSAAAGAARELHQLGLGAADLSIVARDHAAEEQIAQQIDGSPGSEIGDSPMAARLGELSGYVLAAIAIGLPGTGAVVAAGPLAAELGEVAGHLAGDLKAALVKAGVPEAEAGRWRAQIESGDDDSAWRARAGRGQPPRRSGADETQRGPGRRDRVGR